MIPSDLASRLKVMMQSVVQPLAPVTPIEPDLPAFDLGQRFTAQIQDALPDGTFKALVAGRTMTLALPESAKSGDILELVVTGKGASASSHAASAVQHSAERQTTLFAKLAQPLDDGPKPRLSQAGQLISQLLTGRFGEPAPVQLARGNPLLSAPPSNAAPLVPALQQAVKGSGLFYESHQARWLAGELPLAALHEQPQARAGARQIAAARTLMDQAVQTARAQTVVDGKHVEGGEVQSTLSGQQRSAALTETSSNALRIPDSVMPLVHQQLEALATHHLAWQGQVWPGQNMQWDVWDPGEHGAASEHEEDKAWRSTLRLKLPILGGIEAQLILTPAGLALQMRANETQTAERMRAAEQTLRASLEAAGVPLTGMSVVHDVSA